MRRSPWTRPPAATARPGGWRYLELAYDTHDRAQAVVDGVPVTDGRSTMEVVADLGAAGWEMVGSDTGAGSSHVLWFRKPLDAATASTNPTETGVPAAEPAAALANAAGAPTRTVVLIKPGNARFDRDLHARLVAAVAALTGLSGWRSTRIVDKAPRTVAERVPVDAAERMRTVLEELGATVEVR